MKIIKIGPDGLKLIMDSEGFSAKPYLCPANVCTIGYGNTFYEDGTKVKLTDTPISKERGLELLKMILVGFEQHVDSYVRDDINQFQFDALCSFIYNCGAANLKSSTLLKKVNKDPNDPTIAAEFKKWNKGAGKILPGLVKRRAAELVLYFKK